MQNSRKNPVGARRTRRTVALFSLLLAASCCRTVPTEAVRDTHSVGQNESGTGMRAKGEAGNLAPPPPSKTANAPATVWGTQTMDLAPSPEPEVAHDAKDGAKEKTAAVTAPAARAEEAKKPSVARPGLAGLGRLGTGVGGGGLAQRRAGAVGPHALASAAATSAPLQIAPSPSPVAVSPPADMNTESYHRVQENPFLAVKDSPLSTFSVDVDTASYSNMRRFVGEGHLPPADSIRVEEWINYFSYDDPLPSADEPVAITTELTQCPWDTSHRLLRVALGTRPIAQDAVPPRNLVFLIDVSGSMQPANKLPLLKRGLAMLARQLRPQDTLSMVVYAGASGVALPPTSGADQAKILGALGSLESGGSTNGAEGIQLAYEMAQRQFKSGGINRVILASDGDFNVGVTSEGELERLIEQKRKSGVFLTVLGFGEGNLKDSTMERLADKGNGNYSYVDSLSEARKVLVHEAGATLVTVAKDVKLQLEFNPARVKGYRLVGYENRLLADRDFNDDTKDAGEMGAGHHVTAFYELIPTDGRADAAATAVDPLKYQSERTPSSAAQSGDLVTVKIRYKPPAGDRSLLLSRIVQDRPVPFANTTENLRFSAAVAEYALTLRGAPGASVARLAAARAMATAALGNDPRGERHEFVSLMDRAASLPKD